MISGDSYLTLSFDGLTIAANCGSSGNRDWLQEFLVPDIQRVDSKAVDCEVDVVIDADRYDAILGGAATGALLDCFALDSSVVRLPIVHRNGTATTVDDRQFECVYTIEPDHRRVTIVTHPTNLRVRASLLRVVREFAMNYLHGRGLFLHASAIAVGEGGVAFAGHKAAGKTTMLTYLLSSGMGRYLSNDRVFVGDGDAPTLRNIPTVISVRPGTLELCPDFETRFSDSGFASYLRTLDESNPYRGVAIEKNAFGNYFLSPAQYRQILGASQQTCTRASALVFPVVDEAVNTFALRKLSTREALDRIPDALLGAGSWRKGADAFTIPVDQSAPPADLLAERSRRFCKRTPCYELRLGPRSYVDRSLAQVIRTLVPEGAD